MERINVDKNDQIRAAYDLYGMKAAIEVEAAVREGRDVSYINRILKRYRDNMK